MRIANRLVAAAAGAVSLSVIGWAGLERLDRAFPPPLAESRAVSKEVIDRDGALLRAFAMEDGRWRLATRLDQVDPRFLDMLIAYEDKRFREHSGVDFLALLRAAAQLAGNGRIVSGGSTLSMQLARLIEPRQSRSLGQKFRQMIRALQIERRLSKDQILAAMLDGGAYEYVLFACGLAGTFLTGLYTFRLYFLVFGGEESGFVREHLHRPHGRLEGPVSMIWPVGVLAVLAYLVRANDRLLDLDESVAEWGFAHASDLSDDALHVVTTLGETIPTRMNVATRSGV